MIVPVKRPRNGGHSGSVFTALLAGAAMVGAISYMTFQTMSGPVATMQRTTNKAMADQQMSVIAKLLIADASSTDCDSDNSIEPKQWTAGTAGAIPVNAGLLPTTLGLPLKDPWGTAYGYCVWDVGTQHDHTVAGTDTGNCPASASRLDGVANPTAGAQELRTVLAVVSAGPDRHFDTTCYNYSASTNDSTHSTTNLLATATGKDDLVVRYTYEDASKATSALWQLKPSTAGVAQTKSAQNLEVGNVSDFNAQRGAISALNFTASGMISAGGGLGLAPSSQATSCAVGDTGSIRYNTTSHVVEFCDGGGTWKTVGGTGGPPVGTGSTDVNGINHLADGAAEYSTKNHVALGGITSDSTKPLPSVTSGVRNTMTGIGAGAALTTGSDNTGFGYKAFNQTDTGSSNTGFGTQVLSANTAGSRNTAAGRSALAASAMKYSNGMLLKSATPGSTGGSSLTITPPSIAAGDLIIFSYDTDNTGVTGVTFPAGFYAPPNLTAGQDPGNMLLGEEPGSFGIGWKVADGSEGALTVSFSSGTNNWDLQGIVAVYSGVDTSNPINLFVSNYAASPSTAAPRSVTCSGTTTVAGAQLVYFMGSDVHADNNNQTMTPPAGFVQQQQVTNTWSPIYMADMIQGAAGPVSATATQNSTIGTVTPGCFLLALKPTIAPSTVYASDNTAAGYQALTANLSGNYNTAAGYQALVASAIGDYNTAAGYQTLKSVVSGGYNTAAGYGALQSYTGSNATAAGWMSQGDNASVSTNTSAGYDSARTLSTGGENSALGSRTIQAVSAGSSNLAIGALAMGNSQQVTGVSSSGGNVRLNVSSTSEIHSDSQITVAGVNGLATVGTSWMDTTVTVNNGTTLTLVNGWSGIAYSGTYSGLGGVVCFGDCRATSYMTAIGYKALGRHSTSYWDAEGSVAVGWSALAINRFRGGNVAIGDYVLANTTGSDTCCGNDGVGEATAIGASVMRDNNASAARNTAVGYQALRPLGNTTSLVAGGSVNAYENTAVGYNSMTTFVGGVCCNNSGNVALGYNTLASATAASGTGQQPANVALGYRALKALTTGGFGTVVGWESGVSLTTGGGDHLLFGYKAGTAWTSGYPSRNTVFGSLAMSAVGNAGNAIAAYGYAALKGATGTAGSLALFGYNAGAGTNNTGAWCSLRGIGANIFAGGGTTANFCAGNSEAVAFGSGVMDLTTKTASSIYGTNIGFGYQAVRSANNDVAEGFGWQALKNRTGGTNWYGFGAKTLSVGNVSGADREIAFGYQALMNITTGDENIGIGANAGMAITTGNYNVAAGYNALSSNQTANNNMAFGLGALSASTGASNVGIGVNAGATNTSGASNLAVGYGAGPTANNLSNTIAIGNGATVSSSLTAQFGNSSVTHIMGQVGWTLYSDRRLKKDIKDSDLGLDFLMKLRPVSYRMINGDGLLDYGFIAQEVETALDGRVTNMVTQKNDEMKTYQLRSTDILAPVVKAVQQQEGALEARAKDIDGMKTDLLKVQDMLSRLEEGRP